MSMTDEIKKVVAESVEAESVTEEEISEVAEDVVEEEVEVAEAKVKEEEEDEKDSDEDEEEVDESSEEDDEEDEDEVEEVAIPKTKAGVINAALDMLKKARKDEAQQLFAKMVKQVSETSVKKEEVNTESSNQVEDANWDEDLDILVAEEATLSDGFRDKAGAIFEAAYKMKVSAEIDRLESEYAQNLESEVNDLNESLVNKVDSYLNYVVENWVKENEVAIEKGLRTEITEDFLKGLQTLFAEHYIDVPEEKVDVAEELAAKVEELETTLNKEIERNVELSKSISEHAVEATVRKVGSDLSDAQKDKLASLASGIEFENEDDFSAKLGVVKEQYFSTNSTDSLRSMVEDDSEFTEIEESSEPTGSMAVYLNAISRTVKK